MRPDPIILTRDEHIDHLIGYWRQREADRMTDDVLFDEQLRQVAMAMAEPEPFRVDWTAARDVAGALAINLGGLAFGILMIWEMIR